MSKFILLGIACLGMVSCVFNQMEKGLKDFEGKPMTTAVDVLGYPDAHNKFGDDTVYIWSNSFNHTSYTPTTSYTTGYVGSAPVFGQTTTNTARTRNLSCMIKIASGKDGMIKSVEYKGAMAACNPYAKRLHKYSQSLIAKQTD